MRDYSFPLLTARFTSLASTALLVAALFFAAPCSTTAQVTSLSPNVLIVYNSANADSTDVANYYAAHRGIPSANLCPITPASTTSLSWSAFDATVRTPIRNCLSAVGWNNILYIVFTYATPYKVVAPDLKTYSLDQYIADIYDVYTLSGQYGIPPLAQPYYTEAQSEGNVYVPFQSFADYRTATSIPIFSVWRLDAATAALAKGLVDKAQLAESSGLSGQVCVDRRLTTTSVDYGSTSTVEWDLRQAASLARLAGMSVTEDANSVEFGTSPAPLRCDNAALYAGWYSLLHYNDAFTWNPGAIGFHLESASAYDPRGGASWSANALIHGIAVTSGTVSEPYTGLPHPDGVFRNLFEGANVADAFMRNTYWLKWTIINMGDPLYRPFPAGFASVTAPQNSLALVPQRLIGGKPSTGMITLATAAPAGGITAALKSTNPGAATVPPTVIIGAGQTTASFPITTKLVTGDSALHISAIFGSTTLINTLVPQALLAAITLSPVSFIGGTSSFGIISLNDAAPTGGVTINLTSSDPAATVPATVNIPEGASGSAPITITTSSVAVQTTVTISATYAGAKKTAILTVKPFIPTPTLSPTSVVGGISTTANKVTLNGPAPSDTTVSLSSSDPAATVPGSVTIPAGQTVSPLFTISTSPVGVVTPVTISATYGSTTKTATLTVNPIAPLSVTLSPTSVVGGVSTTNNKVTLNSPAPAAGAIVNLSSSDPAVTVPGSVNVAAGQTVSALFTITTASVSATVTPTPVISATYNGISKSATLAVNPVALLSVTASPAAVVGGVSTTLNKVTLNGPAPAGGVSVALSSSDGHATVPTPIMVAAGQTVSPVFTITTSAVTSVTPVTISGSYNGVTKTATLTLNPIALTVVSLSPNTVKGGASTTLNRVALNGPAPAGGVLVTMTSSVGGVNPPASVTVAAGSTTSPYFTITTSPVAATTPVTISGSYNGVTKSATLTVNP